jgi:hypothetical protein
MKAAVLLAILLPAPLLPLAAQENAAEIPREHVEFFEKKIRPLLVDRCYSCHSVQAAKLKAGLYVDSREGLLKGGDSGPALVPGEPDKSLLIKAIRHVDDELRMPKEKLGEEQIGDLVTWIRLGAPDPRVKSRAPIRAEVDFEAARKHWAFVPPRSQPPAGKGHTVDLFLRAALEAKGLAPAPEADRRTLLRRLSFDLVGLPPTPEEIDAFLADPSPDAFEKQVDRLLASPRYGERWGRHWLDVARYADTKEWVVDEERRLAYAYTYRDWVIRAFNEDLPFETFVLQQIAADRLPTASDRRTLPALGFLTVGRSFLNRLPDIIDDRIDVVTRGLLGLTVQCARCHDHKYDPVPTRDYYSLYGVFASSAPPRELPLVGEAVPGPDHEDFVRQYQARNGEITKFREARHAAIMASYRTAAAVADYLLAARDAKGKTDEQLRQTVRDRKLTLAMLKRWVATLGKAAESPVFRAWDALAALPEDGFAERAPAALEGLDLHPCVRAVFAESPASLRDAAEKYGVLLANATDEDLRLALAGPDAPTNLPIAELDPFLTGEDRDKIRKLKRAVDELHNHAGSPPRAMTLEDLPTPHSPRVFIRGNPGTPGDEVPRRFLGILSPGIRTSWTDGGRLELAKAIVDPGNPLTWRVYVNRVWHHHFGAGLVRTPSDFGVRGEPPTHPALLDWLARWFVENGGSTKKLHRLILTSAAWKQSCEGRPETVRADPQNLLLGRQNRRRLEFEPLRDALLAAAGRLDVAEGGKAVPLTTEPYSRRRTVYGHIDRLNLSNMQRIFDFAVPDMHAPKRHSTTVPQQALFMMNSAFVQEQAQLLLRLPAIAAEADPEQKVQRLYRAIFGRAATAREASLALAYLESASPAPPVEPPAWQYGAVVEGRFEPLAQFAAGAWQEGPKAAGRLTATGGQAGPRPLARRWTAPADATVALSGTLSHREKAGDGVRGRIVSSRQGELASWTVCRISVETRLAGLEVKRGETIDFVVERRADEASDAFTWAPLVSSADPKQEWNAEAAFGGPAARPAEPLGAWEKYVQVLLETNEFSFVE